MKANKIPHKQTKTTHHSLLHHLCAGALSVLLYCSYVPDGHADICFFVDANFKGASQCITESVRFVSRNDAYSSIKFNEPANSRKYVVIHQHNDYKGLRIPIMEDVAELRTMQDQISSITIELRHSDSFACLYEDADYRLTPYCAEAGQGIPSLGSVAGMNDKISSVRVTGKTAVTLYHDDNYKGKQLTLHQSNSDLTSGDFGDAASSIKVTD